MLQELMNLLKSANELVFEIGRLFEHGDAAGEAVNRLVAQTTLIQRYVARLGDGLPGDCRDQIARLSRSVQDVVRRGETWLSTADGPELATQVLRNRICRTYGMPARNN